MHYKMNRQLSSFDFYVIASDLQQLKEYYIDKIYQLTRDDLMIRIKNFKTKQKESIIIKNGKFLCVTQKSFETPPKPSMFTMTLRKYLQNGKITGISQHDFDRIIEIKITKKEGVYLLVIEFFSKGNIILVNPAGEIILPLIKQQWAYRKVISKEKYKHPPSQIDPFNLTKENFSNLLKESKTDLVRTLAVKLNLSGLIAEEICIRANIEKNINIEDLDDKNIESVFNAFLDFLKMFKNKEFKPILIKKDMNFIDIIPFKFEIYRNNDFEQVDNFTRSLEEFVNIKKIEEKKDIKSERKIEKLYRQLRQQEETVKKLEKEIRLKKIEGDIIYLNIKQCNELLDEITNIIEQKDKVDGIKKINENEIVKEFDPVGNLLIVYLQDINENKIKVKLDFRKTASGNAEKAYKDSKKYRFKLEGAQQSIVKTRQLIKEIVKKNEIENKDKDRILLTVKNFWFESFRWFISSEGNIIIGGKDAKSNDQVVKKYLKDRDRYAHADIQGAPSCVIKNRDIADKILPISEQTLKEACIFSASYSKAWKQFAEAQAYWVLPEQVSKTPQSGEFVPKGAFIIRGKRNYYRCKLKIAVGEITIGETRKIMGGPVDAVKKISKRYIILTPGNMKKNIISNKLANAFKRNIDELNKVLPPGGISIVETINLELNLEKE